MSETVLIKKKKKQQEKKLSIKEAIAILKPFVVKWKRQDEDMANKMYDIYKQCEDGEWGQVLQGLGFPSSTWYDWVKHFGFELNCPNRGHNNILDTESGQDEQLSDAEYEDNIQTEYDTTKYQSTYTIIHNAMGLKKEDFKLVEKKELLSDLQKLYKKLGGLIVELESDING